jgi:hypothetical protein
LVEFLEYTEKVFGNYGILASYIRAERIYDIGLSRTYSHSEVAKSSYVQRLPVIVRHEDSERILDGGIESQVI